MCRLLFGVTLGNATYTAMKALMNLSPKETVQSGTNPAKCLVSELATVYDARDEHQARKKTQITARAKCIGCCETGTSTNRNTECKNSKVEGGESGADYEAEGSWAKTICIARKYDRAEGGWRKWRSKQDSGVTETEESGR